MDSSTAVLPGFLFGYTLQFVVFRLTFIIIFYFKYLKSPFLKPESRL